MKFLSFLSLAVLLFSQSSIADVACAKKAANLFKTYLKIVEIDEQVIQADQVLSVSINHGDPDSFVNTTQGSYNQEYEAVIDLKYKSGPYVNFKSQKVKAIFVSPFICDNLKIRSFEVVESIK